MIPYISPCLNDTFDIAKVSIILDMEKRYPGKEIKVITEADSFPVAAAEIVEDTEDMWLNYNDEVFVRDGYLFIPPIFNWSATTGYTFTILVK